MKEHFFIKFALVMALASMALGIASCSSDEPAGLGEGMQDADSCAIVDPYAPDDEGKIFLYKDHKVAANTNFTMEQFEQELFSHDAWEEVTISTFRNGGWLSNLNVIEGEVGWTYQNCYEFNKDDESVNIYEWPHYTGQPTDTAYYRIEQFTINPEEKSFTFRRIGGILGETFDVSFIHRIVAVDKDRIIFDQGDQTTGTVTRTSIQPYEIVAITKEYCISE